MTGESNNIARPSTLDTGQSQADSQEDEHESTLAAVSEPRHTVATGSTARDVVAVPDARSVVAAVPNTRVADARLPQHRLQTSNYENDGQARKLADVFRVANYTVNNTYNKCNVVINNGLSRASFPTAINRGLVQRESGRENVQMEQRNISNSENNTTDEISANSAGDNTIVQQNTTGSESQETSADVSKDTVERQNEYTAAGSSKESAETETNMENLLAIAAKAIYDTDGDMAMKADSATVNATPGGVVNDKDHADEVLTKKAADNLQVKYGIDDVPKKHIAPTKATPAGVVYTTNESDVVPKKVVATTQATTDGVVKTTAEPDDVQRKCITAQKAAPSGVVKTTEEQDDVPNKDITATKTTPAGVGKTTDVPKKAIAPTKATPAGVVKTKDTPKKIGAGKKSHSSGDISPDRGARHRSKPPERHPVVKSAKDRKLMASQSSRMAKAKRDGMKNRTQKKEIKSRIPQPVKKAEEPDDVPMKDITATKATPAGVVKTTDEHDNIPMKEDGVSKKAIAPTQVTSADVVKTKYDADDSQKKAIAPTKATPAGVVKTTNVTDGVPKRVVATAQATHAGVMKTTAEPADVQREVITAQKAAPSGVVKTTEESDDVPRKAISPTHAIPDGVVKTTYETDDSQKKYITATKATPAGVVKTTDEQHNISHKADGVAKKAIAPRKATPAGFVKTTSDADDSQKKAIPPIKATPAGVVKTTGEADDQPVKKTIAVSQVTPNINAGDECVKKGPYDELPKSAMADTPKVKHSTAEPMPLKKVGAGKKSRSPVDISPGRGARHRSKPPERRPVVKSAKDRKLRASQSSRIAKAKRDDRKNGTQKKEIKSRIPQPVKKAESQKLIAEVAKTFKPDTVNVTQKKYVVIRREKKGVAEEKVPPDQKHIPVTKPVAKPPPKRPEPKKKVKPEPIHTVVIRLADKPATVTQTPQKTDVLKKRDITNTKQKPITKATDTTEAKPPLKQVPQKKKNVPPDKKTPMCAVENTVNKRKLEEGRVTQSLREAIRNLKPKPSVADGNRNTTTTVNSAIEVKEATRSCSSKVNIQKVPAAREDKHTPRGCSSKSTSPQFNSAREVKETGSGNAGAKTRTNDNGGTSGRTHNSGIPNRSNQTVKKARAQEHNRSHAIDDECGVAQGELMSGNKTAIKNVAAAMKNSPGSKHCHKNVKDEHNYKYLILKLKDSNTIDQMIEHSLTELDLMVFRMAESACEKNINNDTLDKMLSTLLRNFNNDIAHQMAIQVMMYPEKFSVNDLDPSLREVFRISPPLARLVDGAMPGLHIKYPNKMNPQRIHTPHPPQGRKDEKSYYRKIRVKKSDAVAGAKNVQNDEAMFNTVKSFVAKRLRVGSKTLLNENHGSEYQANEVTGKKTDIHKKPAMTCNVEYNTAKALEDKTAIRSKADAFDMFTPRCTPKTKATLKPTPKDKTTVKKESRQIGQSLGMNATPTKQNNGKANKDTLMNWLKTRNQNKLVEKCAPPDMVCGNCSVPDIEVDPPPCQTLTRTPVVNKRDVSLTGDTGNANNASQFDIDTISSTDNNANINDKFANGRHSYRDNTENTENISTLLKSLKTPLSSTRKQKAATPPNYIQETSPQIATLRTATPAEAISRTPLPSTTAHITTPSPVEFDRTPLPLFTSGRKTSHAASISGTPLPPFISGRKTSHPASISGTPLPPITTKDLSTSADVLSLRISLSPSVSIPATPLPPIRSSRSASSPADIPATHVSSLRIENHGTPIIYTSCSNLNLEVHIVGGVSNTISLNEAMTPESLPPTAMVDKQYRMSVDRVEDSTMMDLDTFRSDYHGRCSGRVTDRDDGKLDTPNTALKSHRSQA